MTDRWYGGLVLIGIATVLVLFAFWVQSQQIAVQLVPIQTEVFEQQQEMQRLLEAQLTQATLYAHLEQRVKMLETRPVIPVTPLPRPVVPRPVPVFPSHH